MSHADGLYHSRPYEGKAAYPEMMPRFRLSFRGMVMGCGVLRFAEPTIVSSFDLGRLKHQ